MTPDIDNEGLPSYNYFQDDFVIERDNLIPSGSMGV